MSNKTTEHWDKEIETERKTDLSLTSQACSACSSIGGAIWCVGDTQCETALQDFMKRSIQFTTLILN